MGRREVDACLQYCKGAMGNQKEVALADGKFNGKETIKGEWFGCDELEYMLVMKDDGRPQLVDFDYCEWRDQ